ncbi:hypothetical protein LPJ74_004795 [Coemansia sp. RSA 1843]|nr:hypothetical protein LPJ74_004795 [Coemansia sp. RSA 1843]
MEGDGTTFVSNRATSRIGLGATDPRDWSVGQTTEWLHSFLAITAIPEEFESNGIDGAALVEGMSYGILHHDLGFKVGPALNVMRQVEQLRKRWSIIPMVLEGVMGSGPKEPTVKAEPIVKEEPQPSISAPSIVNTDVPLPSTPTTSVDSASSAAADTVDSGHSEDMQISDHDQMQSSDSTNTDESWGRAISQLSRYLDGQIDLKIPTARRLSLLSAYFSGMVAPGDSGNASQGECSIQNEVDDDNMDVTNIDPIGAQKEYIVYSETEGIGDNDMNIISGSEQQKHIKDTTESREPIVSPNVVQERLQEATSQLSFKNKKDAEGGEEEKNNDEPPKKIRRRVAPCLVTSEIPELAMGNIVEQGVSEARLWLQSAKTLPLDEARKQLELAFPTSSFCGKYRAHAKRLLGAVDESWLPKEALSPSDTMWFRRNRQGRTPTVFNRMLHVQAWHRLFITHSDATLYKEETADEEGEKGDIYKEEDNDQVLPVYGESNSSCGGFSDGLHREIQREQKEQQARKQRASAAERQRISLVEAVVQEMVDRYAAKWHATVKPRMERRAHSLWAKYRGDFQKMKHELDDLQSRRLPRERKAVLDSGISTRRLAIGLCVGLQLTVDSICRTQWLLVLVSGPQPQRIKARLAEDAARNKQKEMRKRHIVQDSDASDSSDSMGDFIDDRDQPQSQQQEDINEGIDKDLEDHVIANGIVKSPVDNASPIAEDRPENREIVVSSTDDGFSVSLEPQELLVEPKSKIQDTVETARNSPDVVEANNDSKSDVEMASGSIAAVAAELTAVSRVVVDPDSETPSEAAAPATEFQAEDNPKDESQMSVESILDSPRPEKTKPQLRYGWRSMAAKGIDGPRNGVLLADSEQNNTVKRKPKQKQKQKQKQPHQQRVWAKNQTQPHMTQEELVQMAKKHKAIEVYDAAVAYVRQMAASAGKIESTAAGAGKVDMRIALRLWAEFQGWSAMGSGSGNSRERSSIGEQFEDVGDALVRIRPAEQRAQRRQLVRTAHNGGVNPGGKDRTSFAAFKVFWSWRHAVAADRLGAPLLVNPDHKSAHCDAWIPGFLATQLHEHQVAGVRFAWRAAIEGCGGCVLAHAMGLGKTLQAITLIYTLLNEVQRGANSGIAKRFASRRVLILCPVTVQDNWVDEFRRWTGIADTLATTPAPPPELPSQFSAADARTVQMQARRVLVQVVHFGRMRTSPMREAALRAWVTHGGVLLMGYQAFRDMMTGELRSFLVGSSDDGGPCLVVADEAHVLKNRQSRVAALAASLPTRARICMTGSPLQNRLEEYWTMADFCKSGLLGEVSNFRSMFVTPINAGLYADSSPAARRYSSQRLRVLQALLEPIVDRRDATVLHNSLPRKVEYVIACPLTAPQDTLYRQYLEANITAEAAQLFEHGVRLGLLCNHPAISMTGGTPAWCEAVAKYCCAGPGAAVGRAELSSKAALALAIVRLSVRRGERVLVFSRSISTLDYLQQAINAELPRNVSSCLRIDGGTPVPSRQPLIDLFNDDESAVRVFLISAATASVGVNLPAASRVIIFDVGWNPLYDDQAVARAYRYGQRKRVYVYRLMTSGTWEEQLFRSNVFKVALTRRVVDGQPMGRWAARSELKRYFREPPASVLRLPSTEAEELAEEYADDLVFSALMCSSHRELIASVTPHATLLANEDDPLLVDDDGPSLEMLVRCEKERLGLLPPSSAGAAANGVIRSGGSTCGAPGTPVAAVDDDVDPENIDAEIIDVENYTAASTANAVAGRSVVVAAPAPVAASSGALVPQYQQPPSLAQHPPAPVQYEVSHPQRLEPLHPQQPAPRSPAATPPISPQAPATATSQSNTATPSSPVARHRVRTVEAMLLAILIRLGNLPVQAPLRNPANLAVFTRLFTGWLAAIQKYIGMDSLDAECRRNKVLDDVMDLIPGASNMMAAVAPVYKLSDADLRRVVEDHTIQSRG